MIKRRRFNKTLGAVLAIPLISSCRAQSNPNFEIQDTVISTWNNVEANEIAYNLLINKNDELLTALEKGINSVEKNPLDQSVGYGGRPDREGQVTLDACIMDTNGNAGSVCYLKEILKPISVARMVMEKTPHVILCGDGAQQFALSNGFEKRNLLTEKSSEEYKEWLKEKKYKPKVNIELHDTIGMLVMNKSAKIVGGCSTSGLAYKMNGRVGDSPIIGAGLYVDNEVGAATATGLGELVLKSCSTFLVVEYMRQGLSPKEACKKAIQRIVSKNNIEDTQVGLVAINSLGEFGGYAIQPGFSFAVTNKKGTILHQSASIIQ